MRTEERACAMRAERISFARVAKRLGVHVSTARRMAGHIDAALQPTPRTVVRRFAHNGGCSTTSGMMPISLPRIEALHGRAA